MLYADQLARDNSHKITEMLRQKDLKMEPITYLDEDVSERKKTETERSDD